MSVTLRLRSGSPSDTEAIGARLGGGLRPADVVVLTGPLGAGKTQLVRGVVGGAGGEAGAVRSPTFVIHQPHRGRHLWVHHLDLYRLGAGADLAFLDIDALRDGGALVVEWGELAGEALAGAATISFSLAGESGRILELAGAPRHLMAALTPAAQRAP